MNRNGSPTGAEPSVGRSFSGLAHDAIELGELQARLLVMDLRASSQRIRTTITVALLGLAVLLGSVPVALLAVAEVLVEQAQWSRSLATGVATLIGLGIAGTLFAVVWVRIKRGISTFDRSREELGQNLAWMKSTLRGSSHGPQERPSPRLRT